MDAPATRASTDTSLRLPFCISRNCPSATPTAPTAAVAAAAVLAVPAPASAQGYGLYEQGACMMGRAGAGVAAPCADASAIYFNPAALAELDTTVVSGGVVGVGPRGQFTNDRTGTVSKLNDRTFPVPSAYYAQRLGRLHVGLGLNAPYGLASDWPTTSEGRFLGYYSSVQGIYIQPTVAARVGSRVDIGGGIDITHLSVELKRRVDLATQLIPGGGGATFAALGVPAGTDFADVRLTGSAVHVGAHVGVQVKANDRVSFGARYLVGQRVPVNNGSLAPTQIMTGRLLPIPLPGVPAGTPLDTLLAPQFASGRALGPQSAKTEIPLPAQFVVGTAMQLVGGERPWTLFADYQMTQWSLFDTITITNAVAPASALIGDYRDTHGLRLGLEHKLRDGVTIRGGVDAHNAAAPDQSVTPILPEASRTEYAVGATVPLTQKLYVDFAYMYIDQANRRGRTIPI